MIKIPTVWLGLLFSVSVFAKCEQEQLDKVIQLNNYIQTISQDSIQIECKRWPESVNHIIIAIVKPDKTAYVHRGVPTDNNQGKVHYYHIHLIYYDVLRQKIMAQYEQFYSYTLGSRDKLSISLDLTPYTSQTVQHNFALKIHHIGQQQNAYVNQVTMDLFYLSNWQIEPILQGLFVEESIKTDTSSCQGRFVILKRKLSVPTTQNYSSLGDIVITQTISSGKYALLKGKCINKTQNEVEQSYKIAFRHGQYWLPDKLRYAYDNLNQWVSYSLP